MSSQSSCFPVFSSLHDTSWLSSSVFPSACLALHTWNSQQDIVTPTQQARLFIIIIVVMWSGCKEFLMYLAKISVKISWRQIQVVTSLCTPTCMCLKQLVTNLRQQHLHGWQPVIVVRLCPICHWTILSCKVWTDGTLNINYYRSSSFLKYAYFLSWYCYDDKFSIYCAALVWQTHFKFLAV